MDVGAQAVATAAMIQKVAQDTAERVAAETAARVSKQYETAIAELTRTLDKNTKRERLLDLANERGLNPSQTMAVGDGANDLDMIGAAGFGVALHAKPAVAAAAGIRIDHGDLTALLYLQGYSEDDFVR